MMRKTFSVSDHQTLNNAVLSQLLFAFVLSGLLLILVEALSLAVQITGYALILVRLIVLQQQAKVLRTLSGRTTKNLSSVLLTLLIVLNAKHMGLLNAMVNLLMAGAVLWWFTLPHPIASSTLKEHKAFTRASQNLVCCLCFLIAVCFIYQQDLMAATMYFAMFALCLFALFLAHNPCVNPSIAFKLVFRYFLIATPVTLALFAVIPNLPPFWQLPQHTKSQTGLSDSMTPGDISELAKSGRLAFRASFDNGSQLRNSELYWRAMTLEVFNGKRWQRLDTRNKPEQLTSPRVNYKTNGLGYAIVMEATQQQWLVALENSVAVGSDVKTSGDNTLRLPRVLKSGQRYEMLQLPEQIYQQEYPQRLTNWELRLNTYLPEGKHPKARELVTEIVNDVQFNANLENPTQMNNRDFVAALLNWFSQGFEYTLTPPVLSGDHIDEFLFSTRAGFCAHYASSFAVLLRMKGIPARVVTGYQGGEYNPNGQYYSVTDASAHAWVEYWQSDEQGSTFGHWVAVDPTAVVSPSRISLGIEPLMQQQGDLITQPAQLAKSIPWLNALRQQIMSLDYYWTIWVLEFDQSSQQQLWRDVFDTEDFSLLVAVLVLLLVLAPILLWLGVQRWRKWQSTPALQRDIDKLVTALSRNGNSVALAKAPITRQTNQTLQEYKLMLLQRFPQMSEPITEFFLIWEKNLYSNDSSSVRERNRRVPAQIFKQIYGHES